jgi:hypothetical protein
MKNLLSATIIILIATFLVPFLCSSALAIPVLDQAQTEKNGGVAFWSDYIIAQTFIPSITGYLDHIYLELSQSNTDSEMMHIQIADWDDSSPGTVLGHVDIVGPGNLDIDFLSQNIFLETDDMYAILMSNDLFYFDPPIPYKNTGTNVFWDGNLYPRGGLWRKHIFDDVWRYDPNTDAVFETWMVGPIPEPSTILLLGFGLIGLVGFSRKKFKKR